MNPVQLELHPPAVQSSRTSRQAAEQIAPTAGTIRAHVLDCIRSAGTWGCTDEEIQNALNLNPSTQRPRRIELVKAGLVYDTSGARRTSSGRLAVVWRAK